MVRVRMYEFSDISFDSYLQEYVDTIFHAPLTMPAPMSAEDYRNFIKWAFGEATIIGSPRI